MDYQELASIISKEPTAQLKRIKAFYLVREIPYQTNTGYDLESILKWESGNCKAKSDLLARLLEDLGYKTRGILARYKLVDFPTEVQFIPDQIDYHHTLQVLINNNWVLVDSTHDKHLASLGFRVCEWDGAQDTEMAVDPIEFMVKGDLNISFKERFINFVEELDFACEKYPEELDRYQMQFNKILEKQRTN